MKLKWTKGEPQNGKPTHRAMFSCGWGIELFWHRSNKRWMTRTIFPADADYFANLRQLKARVQAQINAIIAADKEAGK